MSRLSRAPLAVLALAIVAATVCAAGTDMTSPILERFLSTEHAPGVSYRALRHLEAHNDKFDKTGWMDVWTEADRASGFRFTIVAQGGSEYIREHVMVPALETEQKMWSTRDRAALTLDNYTFEDRGACGDGLVTFVVKPRRKDPLLVDGSMFVRPEDAELVRLEGQLVKPPSFWTRHVHIVRWYERIGGERLPVATESVANVLIAGRSTFRMTYEYETVNGQRVGAPKLEERSQKPDIGSQRSQDSSHNLRVRR